MNNKAQISIGVVIVVAIVLVLVGFSMFNIFLPEIDRARNSDNLDCSNAAGISDGNKLACLTVDWIIPGFFLAVFGGAGLVILMKLRGKSIIGRIKREK